MMAPVTKDKTDLTDKTPHRDASGQVNSVLSVLSLVNRPEPRSLPDHADALDAAEERAGIVEHDGGLPRPEAERLALAAVADPAARRWIAARWGLS